MRGRVPGVVPSLGNQKARWNLLGAERRQRLQQLPGWELDARTTYWEEGFRHLQKYAKDHGRTRVPQTYVVDGYKLGVWINTQRTNWSTLPEERRQRLLKLPGWTNNTLTAQ